MPDADYPEHIREAAQAIDELRALRHRQLQPLERAIQALMSRIGEPRIALAVAICLVCWFLASTMLRSHYAVNDASVTLFNTVCQSVSLVLVIGILSAENTQAAIEQERARLMLQLALIQDRKISDALKALDELRRASPRLPDPQEPPELREATDIHKAASALRDAEEQPKAD